MSITKTEFGKTADNKTVSLYTLTNKNDLSAEILDFGGIVKRLIVPDKNQVPTDVVLGRNTMEDYLNNNGYLGALIGRHANRIKDSQFILNGKTYTVGANENGNSLHGGVIGFDKLVWDAFMEDGDEPSLTLSLTSPDGDEGFPGNLDVTVVYTLTADNALRIEYRAKSDEDTVCNLTNHSYFNLAGHNSGNIYNQVLQMNAHFFTPNTDEGMPNGEVLSVSGTPFDFRVPKPFGQDMNADFEQVQMFSGFDHNFPIAGCGKRLFAVVSCIENGITMEVISDQSAVQLYTSNMLDEGTYKDGAIYGQHNGFCLETQCFPNAMLHRHYPGPVLKKGETYSTVTEYKFIVK